TWRPEGTAPLDSNVPATQEFTAPRIFNKDLGESKRLLAVGVIQQRRSAVALDDSTSIPSQTFYGMLDRLLPRSGIAPWDVLAWTPHVHCGILMHRVDGLGQGLYLLLRNPDSREKVQSALDPSFLFAHPDGCPE